MEKVIAKSPNGHEHEYTLDHLRQDFLSGKVGADWRVRKKGQIEFGDITEILYATSNSKQGLQINYMMVLIVLSLMVLIGWLVDFGIVRTPSSWTLLFKSLEPEGPYYKFDYRVTDQFVMQKLGKPDEKISEDVWVYQEESIFNKRILITRFERGFRGPTDSLVVSGELSEYNLWFWEKDFWQRKHELDEKDFEVLYKDLEKTAAGQGSEFKVINPLQGHHIWWVKDKSSHRYIIGHGAGAASERRLSFGYGPSSSQILVSEWINGKLVTDYDKN